MLLGNMNILHVIPSYAPAWRYGGPIAAVLGLTRELAAQGHNVTVMTTNIDGPDTLDVPTEQAVPMDGVQVWYYPVQRPRWYCFSRPLGRALRDRVAEFDIVHIHSIYLWPTTIAAYWCRRRGVPYLIHAAGALDPVSISNSYAGRRASVSTALRKWLYFNTVGRRDINGAAGMHYTSQVDEDVSRSLDVRPPGHILPFGVEAPAREEVTSGLSLRDEHPELRDKKIVLFLSRLDPIKGLDILIEALGKLADSRDDFVLVVAGGGDRDYEKELASLVNSHGLGDRTVFVGMVAGHDKWSVLFDSDLFVLPSHHENFPMAVVEAMAAGLPVVVSDRVKIHQEVTDAGAGVVTGVDPAQVATAVGSLLSDDERRLRMGELAETLARERLSWEQAARNTVREYEAIVQSRRGTPAEPVHTQTG